MKHSLLCMAICVVSLIAGTTAKAYDFSAINDDGVTIYYSLIGAAADRQVEVAQGPLVTLTDEWGNEYQASRYLEPHYNIPETVTYRGVTYAVVKIGDYTFCESPLQSIVLHEGITTIGSNAFYESSLQSIVLPESLTTISSFAFNGSSLQSIDFPSKNRLAILYSAFSNCSLTSIRWTNNIGFDEMVFSGCGSLHEIVWPEGSFEIPNSMFAGCGFTEIDIPENVTGIGSCAFANNPLKKITIQDNPLFLDSEKIYGNFVNECTELEEIKCYCLVPPNLGNDHGEPFKGISPFNCKLIVPEEVLQKYQNSPGWNKFVNVETFSIPAVSISFENEYIVGEGHNYRGFGPSFTPKNATNRSSCYISVEDLSICSAEAYQYDGYPEYSIFGRSPGETTITATLGDIQTTATVKVVDPFNIYSMNFEESVVQIDTDEQKYITLRVLPQSARIKYHYIPSSSDENIFTILRTNVCDCNIKGISPGTATLTVTASNGMTASCTIVVGGVPQPDEIYGKGPNQLTCKYEPYTTQDPANQVGKDADNNSWRANDIHITDLNEVVNPYTIHADHLTYTRTFNSTNWQELYVPFAMNYDEWSSQAIVAELTGIHIYDDDGDGSPDRTNVEFLSVKEGSLLPNIPYLIKPLRTGTIDFTCVDRTLYPTQDVYGSVYSCTPRWKYTLTGTYVTLADMVGDSFYTLDDDKFRHNDCDVPPLRFFLQMTKQSGGYWGAPGKDLYPDELEISIDGETVTGIDNVTVDYDIDAADGSYYDLMGRKVENPSNGIFLHNNKLIMIK